MRLGGEEGKYFDATSHCPPCLSLRVGPCDRILPEHVSLGVCITQLEAQTLDPERNKAQAQKQQLQIQLHSCVCVTCFLPRQKRIEHAISMNRSCIPLCGWTCTCYRVAKWPK